MSQDNQQSRGGQSAQSRQPQDGQQPQGGQPQQQPQRGGQGQRSSQNADLLMPGEEVLIDARPAWSAWTGILVVAGLILLGTLLSRNSGLIAFGLIVALGIVGYVWYQRRKVRYLITDNRVMVVTGITSRKTNEAWLEDVKSMQTGASFLERLLGHGHITVSRQILPRGGLLPGRFGAQGLTLGGIHKYDQIAQVIRERQAERKMETGG